VLDRRLKEITLLRDRFGELETGFNSEWILFRRFQLPPGWNRTVIEILVEVPPAYPQTPPDNFYVTEGLRTASGGTPGNYSEGVEKYGKRWAQFSYHVQDWSPSSDLLDGHNLLTFVLGVEQRLREIP